MKAGPFRKVGGEAFVRLDEVDEEKMGRALGLLCAIKFIAWIESTNPTWNGWRAIWSCVLYFQHMGAAVKGVWRLFTKNTGLCQRVSGRIQTDACPVSVS